MGAGGRPAGVPHDHAGVGEADRVARRHGEAGLEAAARFEGGNRDGPHLRPDEGRARPSGMPRRLLVMGAALAAACASRSGGPVSASAPVPPPRTAPPPPPPGGRPAARRSDAVRYGPSALRYRVHRRVHIEQALGGQTQVQDLGVRVYVAATISGPADSIGYPATFTVDSMVADSGAPLPPPIADNVSRARRLIFSGRLVARGEFVKAMPSDSALAQSLIQLLANFRDFLPRIPGDGLKPGVAWTDTLESTQKGSSSEISRRGVLPSAAPARDDQARAHRLPPDARPTGPGAVSGPHAGQPVDLSGAGRAP